jgi:hypothetical protein
VQRRIVGFRQDEVGDWIADLECGHSQHVRHDPPWQVREWVLSESGRRSHLTVPVECRECETRSEKTP